MATSQYFNNIGASNEQNLIEDLIVEAIKIYGIDMYYIPRTTINKDNVFREGETYSFGTGISIEMYLKSANDLMGEGEFLSKFGLEVRDQLQFVISQRSFDQEITSLTNKARPFEGDLVWFPLTQALYQIKFVNKKPVFYQLGALQVYEMTVELFEYSSEIFNTGIPTIDNLYNAYSMVTNDYILLAENGNELATENGIFLTLEEFKASDVDQANAENEYFESEAANFVDFTEIDPFSEGRRT